MSIFSDRSGGKASAAVGSARVHLGALSAYGALLHDDTLSGPSPSKALSEAEFSNSWFLTGVEILVLIAWSIATGFAYYRLALRQTGDLTVFVATGALVALTSCAFKRLSRSEARIVARRKLDPAFQTLAFWCASFIILSFLVFSFHISLEVSRGAVLVLFFTGLPVLSLARGCATKLFATHLYENSLRSSDAVIIGCSQLALADAVSRFLARGSRAPMIVKIDASSTETAWPNELERSIKETTGFAHKAGPGAIYVCAQDFPEDRFRTLINGLQIIPRAVRIIPDAVTAHLMSFPVRNDIDCMSVEVQGSPLTNNQRSLKRAFDLLVSVPLVVLLLPLFAAIAIAIKLDSRGPVFFRQTRLGYHGRPFRIFKFRTMFVLEDGADIQAAKKNDPRITRIGKFLRKTYFDEFPQLINVIRDEMSLVGPRPHAAAHDQVYSSVIANYELRQHVKPGITGWAQVHGLHGEASASDLVSRRVEFDIWYAKNASIALDAEIILRTLAVMMGRGIVEGARSPQKTDSEVTRILGIPIDLIDMQSAVATITSWSQDNVGRYVCVRDVHGLMRAQNDPALRAIHEEAALVTPDGMPLVWISRLRLGKIVGRVCGPDLVDALCAASSKERLAHYFYGGKPGVAESMAAALRTRFPGLNVVGTLSPPFGDLSPEEDARIVKAISTAKPHIVWVGLSSPKQEYWMRDHVGHIPGATLIGVGAAFDFHAGEVTRAPIWMQKHGLEWLHRLYSEPRRLWRRYLILAPNFAVRAIGEQILPSVRAERAATRFGKIPHETSERKESSD